LADTHHSFEIISCKAAKADGRLMYYTGKPCPRDHIDRRYVSTHACLSCHRDISAKLREKTALRRQAKVPSIRQQALLSGTSKYWSGKACPKGHITWRTAITGACCECSSLAGKRRHARPEFKERRKQYLKENVERYRSHTRNRRAKTEGTHTAEDIADIFRMQNGKCAYCRKKLEKYHVDHIVPMSKGGLNWRSNLQLTCPSCNLRKNSKNPMDFAKENGLLL